MSKTYKEKEMGIWKKKYKEWNEARKTEEENVFPTYPRSYYCKRPPKWWNIHFYRPQRREDKMLLHKISLNLDSWDEISFNRSRKPKAYFD